MTEPVDMRDPTSALGESLAVAEGNLALFWGSASHRRAYMATAAALLRPLEVRGWRIVRDAMPDVPRVTP